MRDSAWQWCSVPGYPQSSELVSILVPWKGHVVAGVKKLERFAVDAKPDDTGIFTRDKSRSQPWDAESDRLLSTAFFTDTPIAVASKVLCPVHEASGLPVHKRQRLSSPTYDDQVEELTQEHLAAFDAIELQLSQQANPPRLNTRSDLGEQANFETPGAPQPKRNIDWGSSQPQESSSYPGFAFARAKNANIRDDLENPFTLGSSNAAKEPSTSTFAPALLGFASASKLPNKRHYERSPSPEAPPPEPNFDAWFTSGSADIPAAFETAGFSSAISAMPVFKKASAIPLAAETPNSEAPLADHDMDSWFNSGPTGVPLAGFTSASVLPGFTKPSVKGAKGTSGVIMPSKEALAKAKAMLDSWNNEDDSEPPSKRSNDENADVFQKPHTLGGLKLASTSALPLSPKRTAFASVINTAKTPVTPTLGAGFGRPSLSAQSKSISTPNLHRPGAFKPPSFNTPKPGPSFNSPFNPNCATPIVGFTSAATQHMYPLAAPPIVASHAAHATPMRDRAPATRVKSTPTTFKTPFKPGMAPGGPGRASLVQTLKTKNPHQPQIARNVTPATKEVARTSERPPSNLPRKTFFNMTAESNRINLWDSGLHPRHYDIDEMEELGINAATLAEITPETAMYYSFHSTESTPPPLDSSVPPMALGPGAALKELLDRGCTLATKPWVDNHWSLILWKLAGMVNLDPRKETNPDTKRWCWSEVIKQLLYRYERELNGGSRPPLRKIANQDAPPGYPMVLCVSNILWSPPSITEDGMPIEPHPELEMTDGWYRLRAQVDLPMARAVRKGVICIGRKIGVAGARLSTEKKDPTEILEAYNSTKLVFSGNSSHLMPWHVKLGFMRGPCISTLHSLTHDGGVVTALDFVITKMYPIAFIEFIEDESGNKHQEGPRNEAEESKVNEQWKRKYEMEASKLRAVYEKKASRYEGYIDRLERKTGNNFNPGEDDYPPENIDSLYDELEYPDSAAAVIARVSSKEAGWLVRHIRKQTETNHERIAEEIEKELKTICPARNVRSFRILIVQDARTSRRPANRKAQLTVWDICGLTLDEGKRAGGFEIGQRFMATNLIPKQPSAWMDCEPGSEVYLCTRRDTRWTRIKGVAP